jgi:hypothetical protein
MSCHTVPHLGSKTPHAQGILTVRSPTALMCAWVWADEAQRAKLVEAARDPSPALVLCLKLLLPEHVHIQKEPALSQSASTFNTHTRARAFL